LFVGSYVPSLHFSPVCFSLCWTFVFFFFVFLDILTNSFLFKFKLIGQVSSAIIHIQSLPKGTKVSSPDEAHQGQTNYNIANEDPEIIGFFSTEHTGVFIYHDSYLHMHLIT